MGNIKNNICKENYFVLILILLLTFAINIHSQDEEIELPNLTAEDGLSLSGVTKVFQDSRGFLWFGTYNGLNRYDGYNFKIFLPDPANPKSISSHHITAIYEDKEGFIWFGTNNGLNKYNWKTDQFQRYYRNPKDSNSISHNLIYSIFEDRSGSLWIGTFNGLNKLNKKKNNFQFIELGYKNEPLYKNTQGITSICQDHKGNLWIGTWNGLVCLDTEGRAVKYFYAAKGDHKTINFREVTAIFEDNSKNLWIGTNGNGINRYDEQTGIFHYYHCSSRDPNTISNDYINVIFQDRLRNIWIGTKNGLNKYEQKRDCFRRIFQDSEKSFNNISNEILSIDEDRTGIVWIGTSEGVSRFYEPNNRFKYYQENKGNPLYNLTSNRVNSICSGRDNNIWVGTLDGLDEIKTDGTITHYKHDAANNNSLSNNFVLSVAEDHNGTIWIGTNKDGLNSFNPATGKVKKYLYNANDRESISNAGVTSILEDHTGTLWVGTWWGLNRFNRETGKFLRYVSDISDPYTLKNNLIWVIYEDSQGMLWIGTDGGGVSKFNTKEKKFTNFVHDSLNTNNISGNRVISIFESKDHIMWFGTTNGLSSFNRKTGIFTCYQKKDGLAGDLINGILEDDEGFLWIATDKGISKFDRRSKSFYNYTKRNGLKTLEFSPNVSFKGRDGQLYFGSKSGLMHFYPDEIEQRYLSAPVVFTDLKIYNSSVPISSDPNSILKESISAAEVINIPYDKDVITFEFALLDYFNVKKNKFSYQLSGFDQGWNNVESRNNATYTNLPPGEYTLQVKAFSEDGIKIDKEASIRINIIPAYYQTETFRAGAALGIILFIILAYKVRTRAIKKQNKLLETKVADRTKDLDKTIANLSKEIIEREKAEAKVQASLSEKNILLHEKENLLDEKENLLKEKDVLLKEIHHRVKNNLQVISSLLYLNSKKVKDKEALSMFTESQNRVKSIALVHERLYRSKDLGKIDFNEYVVKLTNDLFRSYAVNQSVIKLEINIKDIFINIDMAVPCGLIINELISNSLKYAFPNYAEFNKEGKIKITFNTEDPDQLVLLVSDNGIGLPAALQEKKKLSLGLHLVDTLVNQLEGTLQIASVSGTEYKIKFPFK